MTATTYWLSFADENRSYGVAIVDGDADAGIEAMIQKTIDLGCNPDGRGAVQMQTLRPGSHKPIPEHYKNRLLTQDEIKRLNAGEGVEKQ